MPGVASATGSNVPVGLAKGAQGPPARGRPHRGARTAPSEAKWL